MQRLFIAPVCSVFFFTQRTLSVNLWRSKSSAEVWAHPSKHPYLLQSKAVHIDAIKVVARTYRCKFEYISNYVFIYIYIRRFTWRDIQHKYTVYIERERKKRIDTGLTEIFRYPMYIHRYPQININQQVYHDFPHTVMWLKQFHEPSPSHHNFYRWYKLKGYHSQSWVVYGIVFPISLTMLGPSSTVPCTAHQCRSASAILHGLKGFERPRNVMPIFWSPPK